MNVILKSARDDNSMPWDSTHGDKPHLLNFSDLNSGVLEAFEFVVNEAISVGTVVFAGESGCGKTSVLVGMALCAAGLTTESYKMKSSERRRFVIYAAEDIGQVKRIVAAMMTDGTVINDLEEVARYFKVVEAQRSTPDQIVAAGEHLRALTLSEVGEQGEQYPIEPLLVLDTTNANIDLNSENDNAEVGRAIAKIRTGLSPVNVWLIAHTAKGAEGRITARGAGAFKGDVQQLCALGHNEAMGGMVLDLSPKIRGEDVCHYWLINKRSKTVEVKDRRQRCLTQTLVYGDPEPISMAEIEAKRKSEADAKKAEKHAETLSTVRKEIIAALAVKGEPMRITAIKESVTGRDCTIIEVVAEMVEQGELSMEKGKYSLGIIDG